MNSMTPRRRVAALLVLAAGGDAAWTVGRPHTAAAAHRAASSAACAPAAQGMLGLEFASDRPTETKSLHCPSGFITGIRVRYGRRACAPLAPRAPCPAPMPAPDGRGARGSRTLRSSLRRTRSEDRDLYDFKLKCGNRWTSWSGLWFKSEVEDKEWECPSKMYVTGTRRTAKSPSSGRLGSCSRELAQTSSLGTGNKALVRLGARAEARAGGRGWGTGSEALVWHGARAEASRRAGGRDLVRSRPPACSGRPREAPSPPGSQSEAAALSLVPAHCRRCHRLSAHCRRCHRL